MRLRKNSRPYDIVKNLALAAGDLLLIPLVTPYKGNSLTRDLIARYQRGKKLERRLLFQDLKRLQERKLIEYKELPDDIVSITLAKGGKKYALRYRLDSMELKQDRWDGKWRIILFDIPNYNKKAREAFRMKLRELRCYLLQKSVYITPWQCANEIDFLCSVFEIPRSNILLFEVSKFEGSEKLRQYFQL